ncbi:hypothetical protein [Nocardia colli]|uniref:hypothetical protein n=1 Tax=Nocardia colli TaxID=2545717 RepID=UPI0035E091B3
MNPTPTAPDNDRSEPVKDGGSGRIPLLLLAGTAAFLAPAVRFRRGASSQQLTIAKPWDGGEQTFVLMTDPAAPREYRFPQQVPPGGHLHTNPDGSIDVLAVDGNIVSHTNPPWAYDALGRPVRTWYDTYGDTIVQHIEPDADNVFPILADPDSSPSCSITDYGNGQTKISIDNPDGSTTTIAEDGKGNTSRNTTTSGTNSTGVSSEQQAADQLARAHGDVPDDYSGHVPVPAKPNPQSSPTTSAQGSGYQPTPSEQQAADQLARAHGDVPDGFTGHVPVAPPPGRSGGGDDGTASALSNGSTAIGGVGGAAQGAATKTPQGSHWAPGSGPVFTPEEAARAGKLAGRLSGAANAMELFSMGIDLADGKPAGETVGKSSGAIGGGWAGAYAGAAIGGAVGGPVGALIGGGIGAFAGSTYGAKAGKWLGSLFD